VRGSDNRSYYGRNKALADAIGRPPSWVTEYINGENHANLDTSVALMRYLGWSLAENLSEVSDPPVPGDLAIALRDAETAEQVRAFLALPAHFRQILVAMPVPGTPHTPARPAESTGDTLRAVGTKSARGRRR